MHAMEQGSVQEHGRSRKLSKIWVINEHVRVGFAETLSTYVMMVFGLGSVAQVVTGRGAFGEYLSVNLGFGLGVAMGVHIGGRVSGAHMNAAVSFSMCLFGRLGWRMLPVYILSQLIGSFLAAGTIYSLYYDAIYHYCGGNLTVSGPKATAGIFATYPAPYLSLHAGFLDQVIGTAMLLLCLMALSDQRNQPAPSGGEPIAVGLLVLLIGVSLGSNSGYAINPSRDLGPRIFTAIAGWGPEVFRAGNGWWWVPVLAPMVGGVTGASIYKVFVELHHPSPCEHRREIEDEAEEEAAPLDMQKNLSPEVCV
ncbi:aquaporin-7 [Oncorhynchus nerka]|uniref:aquaporin-7 n=1 Tax=Oncorhynchus nerka TaxID=8023 RepID=UPI0011312912|nr:aquaporin-7-like [Oncorhynchus nerka]